MLEAQFNRDPADMADARIAWDSPCVPLGKIVIPQQNPSSEVVFAIYSGTTKPFTPSMGAPKK